MTLRQFLNVMRQKLRENEHKGGWHGDDLASLLRRAREELNELAKLLQRDEIDSKQIARAAAEVANFCYMIADNAAGD